MQSVDVHERHENVFIKVRLGQPRALDRQDQGRGPQRNRALTPLRQAPEVHVSRDDELLWSPEGAQVSWLEGGGRGRRSLHAA